jgi:predicted nucleotidyltransferase
LNRRLSFSRLPAEPFARARAADVKNAPRYAGRPLDPGWIVAELSFRFWLLTHGPPVPAAVAADPILKRFRAALAEIYGDRIERVVLFGSRARGDASDDSDYDVALFMNDLKEGDLANRWRELDRLADLRSEILADTEAFIDAKPYPAGAYRNPTGLMGEIRREGVDL